MKKFILAVLLFPLFVFSQQQKVKPHFVVNGNITGVPEGTAVQLLNANDNSSIATGKVLKGKFQLKGAVPEPVLTSLVIGDVKPYLYLDNKNITITGKKSEIKNIKVTGSPVHNQFLQFQNSFTPLMTQLNSTGSALNITPRGPQFDKLMVIYDSLLEIVQASIDRFIKANPGSYVSPFVLLVTSQLSDDIVLMENRFKSLDPAIRNSNVGKNLQGYIDYYKVGAVGTAAMDFTQPDTSGHTVSLSSFRGKYVLVDFWASWCGPCRAENPNVVSNYETFKTKNFTVLGVSLDKPEGRANWIGAIQRDNLTWTHVSDLKFWNNEAAQLYHVQSIPFNMLVDPNGIIIAKNLRGEKLREELCKVLGCN